MANDIGTRLHINQEVHANEKLLDELTSQQSELETTRKNLTNPDYLEMIARGKYHVSKTANRCSFSRSLAKRKKTRVIRPVRSLRTKP